MQRLKLIQIIPEEWFNRGTIYIYKRDYEKALHDFNKAINLKPDYYEAYCNRGAALAYMKNMNESLKDFNKAVQINPQFAEAYYSRGFTKLCLNDTTGACSDWKVLKQLGYENAANAINRYCK